MLINWLKKILNNHRKNPSVSPFSKGRGREEEARRKTGKKIAEIKRGKITEIDPDQITEINDRLAKLEADLEKATTGYRQMLINNNPDILPEMISGDSIEDLEHSVETAKILTDRIKEKLEAKAAAEKIPAGAPPRTPPNLDNLDSHAKIVYGLEKK